MNRKKIVIINLILSLLAINSYAQFKLDTALTLSTENIIKITFNNSDRIKSAYFNLESAKYNFKLFENEYTQFNPLIVDSKVNSNSDKQYSGDFSTGMRKEFFDGTSIEASVGNSADWGNNVDARNVSFFETEISFPLFTSARKLSRLIKRTFEENELYTKNLDYVDAVKENVHDALEQYYDLVPRIKTHEMLKHYRDELKNLLANNPIQNGGQIEGEIATLNSKITGWEIILFSKKLSMQRYMNVNNINMSNLLVINVDFKQDNYYGKYYIEQPTDSIFNKALNNDSEFKVLGIIKKNAEEKKRLAQKGKWDIFATTGGRYNYYEMRGGERQNNFLMANAGLNIKRYDNKMLKNTIAKAQSDISAIEYTIEDRKKLIKSNIEKLKDGLTKKKEQLINTLTSLNSWSNIYQSKKELYLSGDESVDNFIQSFRSLLSTEETHYNLENNYLDLIRDFDYITGSYFEYIELKN
ncbi:MAG: TolC family protein [Draconibacterium sp.]|nr:TolC family protein [Draconibacterium sp.]